MSYRIIRKLVLPSLDPDDAYRVGCAQPDTASSDWAFMLYLEAPGNLDRRQTARVAEPVLVFADDMRTLIKLAADYRDRNELGGGNWAGMCGMVYHSAAAGDGTPGVKSSIAYNGSIRPVGPGTVARSLSSSAFAAWVHRPKKARPERKAVRL